MDGDVVPNCTIASSSREPDGLAQSAEQEAAQDRHRWCFGPASQRHHANALRAFEFRRHRQFGKRSCIH